MDGLTLMAAARLLQARYAGARVSDVREAVPPGVWLGFGGRLPGLALSIHPELSGVFPRAKSEQGRKRAGAQVLAMRRRLNGARLTGAVVRGVERVLTLRFEKGSAVREPEEVTLVLEATGRWSNVILVEGGERRVTAALKIYAEGEGGRSVLPGASFMPLAPNRLDPCVLGRDELAGLIRQHGVEGFGRLVEGLSPGTLGGLVEEAGSDDPDPVAAVLAGALAEPPARGRVIERQGSPSLALVFNPEVSGSDLLDALEDFYGRVAGGIDHRARRTPLQRRIREDLKAARRLRDKLRREEEEAAQADRLREEGTLLMAHLGEIPRGAAEFVTEAPFGQPGSRESVPLDPRYPAAVNAERLFRRARRMKARMAGLGKRLEIQEKRIGDLEELARRVEACGDAAGLEQLAVRFGRLSKPEPAVVAAESRGKPRRAARPFLEYLVAGGYRIIVGKDAASNDYILSRVASGEDVWCHADGYSGAHVIVKGSAKGAPLPPGTLREACMLAAYHSRGRTQTRLNVSYTRRKYVRKPKGAPAGLVVLDRRQTMLVEPSVPDGARLKED